MCRKSKETDVFSQLVSVGDVSREFQVSSHSKFPSLKINFKRKVRLARGASSRDSDAISQMTTCVYRLLTAAAAARMTTCRQPELKYNPLLPHLIVFILITIKSLNHVNQVQAALSISVCFCVRLHPHCPSVCREPRQILLILNR